MIKLRSLTIITARLRFHSKQSVLELPPSIKCKVAEGAKPITSINDCNLSFHNFSILFFNPKRLKMEKRICFCSQLELLLSVYRSIFTNGIYWTKFCVLYQKKIHRNALLFTTLRDEFSVKINKNIFVVLKRTFLLHFLYQETLLVDKRSSSATRFEVLSAIHLNFSLQHI